MLLCNGIDLIHLCALAIQMNGNDCLGLRRDQCFELGRIHAERSFINVAENNLCAQDCECGSCCDPAQRSRNDFIPCANTGGNASKRQTGRCRSHGYSVVNAAVFCKRFFKFQNFLATRRCIVSQTLHQSICFFQTVRTTKFDLKIMFYFRHIYSPQLLIIDTARSTVFCQGSKVVVFKTDCAFATQIIPLLCLGALPGTGSCSGTISSGCAWISCAI